MVRVGPNLYTSLVHAYLYIVNTSRVPVEGKSSVCVIFMKLEGARPSTGLCVDVSSGVMI